MLEDVYLLQLYSVDIDLHISALSIPLVLTVTLFLLVVVSIPTTIALSVSLLVRSSLCLVSDRSRLQSAGWLSASYR